MSDQKLSYDPSKVPVPATNPDYYNYAQLVEMRLIRQALQQIATDLRASLEPVVTAKTKAK